MLVSFIEYSRGSLLPGPERRLDILVRAIQQVTLENEAAFRTMLQLSLESHATGVQNAQVTKVKLRGWRRIDWIEEDLAPVRKSLEQDESAFRRLVAALSLCLGTEALIVLQDVCGLEAKEAVEVSCWAVHALLQAGYVTETEVLLCLLEGSKMI